MASADLRGLLRVLNNNPVSKMAPIRRSKRLVFLVRLHEFFLVER